MKTVPLGPLEITAIIIATLWFRPQLLSPIGLDRHIQNARLSLPDIAGGSNSKKCTTASGEVIYGTTTKPEDCLKIELIDTHVTIVESQPIEEKRSQSSIGSLQNTTEFNCDGRTHCSEMRSCEEARFFLNNCTNMRVDGDQGGIPCEKQWC